MHGAEPLSEGGGSLARATSESYYWEMREKDMDGVFFILMNTNKIHHHHHHHHLLSVCMYCKSGDGDLNGLYIINWRC